MDNPKESGYYVYFGTVGWESGGDVMALYPEDLPADWRLAFYATQFRCVYLPVEKWVLASDEEVGSWLAETNEHFRFVLQSPDRLTHQHQRLVSRFGKRGILDKNIDLHWLDGKGDLRQISSVIQRGIGAGRTVYLIARDANLTLMRQIGELMDVLGA